MKYAEFEGAKSTTADALNLVPLRIKTFRQLKNYGEQCLSVRRLQLGVASQSFVRNSHKDACVISLLQNVDNLV